MLEIKLTQLLVDKLDKETRAHSIRVSLITDEFAKYINMDQNDRLALATAALLHDVGKMSVDQGILQLERRLNEQERKIIEKHADYGYSILKYTGRYNKKVLQAVKQHHENWDGTGYSKGLQKNEISFFAQIIHIVDVYDAIRSKRSYKPAFSEEVCIDYLKDNSGTMFNPVLINKFVTFMENLNYEIICK